MAGPGARHKQLQNRVYGAIASLRTIEKFATVAELPVVGFASRLTVSPMTTSTLTGPESHVVAASVTLHSSPVSTPLTKILNE